MLHSIEFWRTAGILFAAVGQTLFALLYVTFPWWKNFLGRALFFKAVVFMVLVDVAVAGRIWDWPHEDAIFVGLYWVLGLGIWVQVAAFARVKWQRREDTVSGNERRVSARV